jgi:SAM-dependent methyltransferase
MICLPSKIRRRLEKSVLQHGVPRTVRRCLIWPFMYIGWKIIERTPFERQRRQAGEAFDRQYGVDTTRNRSTEWAADIDSENWAEGTGYDPTPPDTVRRSIQSLQIDHEEYVFIDLGSGKGRVTLVASEFPFKECLGVEYAPDLHEVAVRNIAAFSSDKQRCKVVKSCCRDAAKFPIPEAPLVLFFHDPFSEVVLDKFLQNVQRSLREKPRRVYVIEYDPVYRDQFRNAGFSEIGCQNLGAAQFLPKFFYKLKWLELNTFRNRLGKEFGIYANTEPDSTAILTQDSSSGHVSNMSGINHGN